MPGMSLDKTQRPSPELPERGLRPSARYIRSRTSEHRAPLILPLKPTQKYTPYTRYVSKIISVNPIPKSSNITTRIHLFPFILYFPHFSSIFTFYYNFQFSQDTPMLFILKTIQSTKLNNFSN